MRSFFYPQKEKKKACQTKYDCYWAFYFSSFYAVKHNTSKLKYLALKTKHIPHMENTSIYLMTFIIKTTDMANTNV